MIYYHFQIKVVNTCTLQCLNSTPQYIVEVNVHL